MARWQLAEEPFAVIVTGTMIDEFKGTLACAGWAEGLHRVPRRRRRWFPFKGTISVDEDTREVLRARVPVYLNDPGH